MITSIHYKNFKALQDATLPLGRFTLIVGANGTGKSTALQSIEYMRNRDANDFDKIVLVTGDGDYIKMVKYLIEKRRIKKMLFPNSKYSSLYKTQLLRKL